MVRITHPFSGQGRLTQDFGVRTNAYLKFDPRFTMHNGKDIALPEGTAILAERGEVVESGWDSGYGNYVKLWCQHLNGWVLYAHMSRRLVSVGQRVDSGQVIGYVGSTGNSTGPHLHMEYKPYRFNVNNGALGRENFELYVWQPPAPPPPPPPIMSRDKIRSVFDLLFGVRHET